MDYSLLIAYLRQKQYITDLEKDILDTWNELQKSPFDRSSAQLQIMQNNAKHPEILAAIKALPTTVVRPFDQVTETIFYKGIMPSETGFRFSSGL